MTNGKCCRSLPRCGDCPVVLAARARAAAHTPIDALLAQVRAPAPRTLPACVEEALTGLDRRQGRFERAPDPVPTGSGRRP
jgi:hypothetical protein